MSPPLARRRGNCESQDEGYRKNRVGRLRAGRNSRLQQKRETQGASRQRNLRAERMRRRKRRRANRKKRPHAVGGFADESSWSGGWPTFRGAFQRRRRELRAGNFR